MLLLPELLDAVVLLLVLLRREEFLDVVLEELSSLSSAFLGIALVINLTALIGCALIVPFLLLSLGRLGNFSTGIPLVASFINRRQV